MSPPAGRAPGQAIAYKIPSGAWITLPCLTLPTPGNPARERHAREDYRRRLPGKPAAAVKSDAGGARCARTARGDRLCGTAADPAGRPAAGAAAAVQSLPAADGRPAARRAGRTRPPGYRADRQAHRAELRG